MNVAQLLENFLQALTAGLLTGTIYGLMCVGLSVIFGVMRVINFAQGDFVMLGMYVAYYAFGSTPVSIAPPLSSSAWAVGPLDGDAAIFVNQGQTVAAVIAVIAVLGFVLFMARSRLGKSLRAAADNAEAAIYMGIDVDRAHRLAFGFGVGLTAIGGGLLASGGPFQPYVGLEYVIVMYAGVVLGGLRSVSGPFFGGLA